MSQSANTQSGTSFRTLGLVALFSVAYATNPDVDSFRRYMEFRMRDELRQDEPNAGIEWISGQMAKAASRLSSLNVRLSDYKIFSIANDATSGKHYFGAFGMWFEMPSKASDLW